MKLKSLSQVKKKADKIFSEYIRRRDKGKCFTCGSIKRWQEQQCGHYIPRQYNQLRYNEQNSNCQCVGCNVFKGGNKDDYAIGLIRKYGVAKLEEFFKIKHFKTKIFKLAEFEEIIRIYQQKLEQLD